MPFASVTGKLIDGEKVIKEWSTKDWTKVLATNHRLFLMRDKFLNKQSVEVPYEEITSLEFLKRRPRERLIGTVVFSSIDLAILYIHGGSLSYGLTRGYDPFIDYFTAILLASFGFLVWFLMGVNSFAIHIAGRQPVYISKELEELYYFARLHLMRNAFNYTHIKKDDQQYQKNEDQQHQNMPQDYLQVD
jgi:hypothetical protein